MASRIRKKRSSTKLVSLFDFEYFTSSGVSLETWCDRYGIEVQEQKCLDCERIRRTTVPAFNKGWRGLMAPPCECGTRSVYRTFVLTNDAEIKELDVLFGRGQKEP